MSEAKPPTTEEVAKSLAAAVFMLNSVGLGDLHKAIDQIAYAKNEETYTEATNKILEILNRRWSK